MELINSVELQIDYFDYLIVNTNFVIGTLGALANIFKLQLYEVLMVSKFTIKTRKI